MKRPLMLAAVALVFGTSIAMAHDRHRNRFAADLKPTEEVPALSSTASGSFAATIDEANQIITYELKYDALEAAPAQAHIHVGQQTANGGVSVFLCGNAPTVPPATVPQPPACPPGPATITGTITPANIIGPAAQGVAATTATANEFAELVALIRAGVTYANVHSSKFPAGEIRGQIRSANRHDKD